MFFNYNHNLYFPPLLFVIKSRDQYKSNFEIHVINIRHGPDLHPPSRLTVLQKGAFYFGIKECSHLPSITENLYHEKKQFRHALKRFLRMNSFYHLL
jgi:hypothetical protein